jgi:hypothetical protein
MRASQSPDLVDDRRRDARNRTGRSCMDETITRPGCTSWMAECIHHMVEALMTELTSLPALVCSQPHQPGDTATQRRRAIARKSRLRSLRIELGKLSEYMEFPRARFMTLGDRARARDAAERTPRPTGPLWIMRPDASRGLRLVASRSCRTAAGKPVTLGEPRYRPCQQRHADGARQSPCQIRRGL